MLKRDLLLKRGDLLNYFFHLRLGLLMHFSEMLLMW